MKCHNNKLYDKHDFTSSATLQFSVVNYCYYCKFLICERGRFFVCFFVMISLANEPIEFFSSPGELSIVPRKL